MQIQLSPEEQKHVNAVITVKIAMQKVDNLIEENQIDDATTILKQVIKVTPDYQKAKDKLEECEDKKVQILIDQAKQLVQESIEQSKLYLENGLIDDAEVLLQQIIRVDPESQEAYHLLGICHQRKQDHTKGIEYFEKAIELDPNNAHNYNDLALCYSCLGNGDKAFEILLEAIKRDPNNPAFYNNLGLQYRHFYKYDKAIAIMEKGLEINPKDTQILHNLGGIYGENRQLEEAKKYLLKAIEIDPDFSNAHMSLGSAYMLEGDYEKGWKEFEYRFDAFQHLKAYRACYDQSKKWDGEQSLDGKKVIIYCEQGIGDSIMMLRYIKFIKDKGAYTILHCSPKLEDLFTKLKLGDELLPKEVLKVYKDGKGLPEHDYHISLMSLPYLLGKANPEPEVYISTDRKANFEEYKDKVKVGICWAGSIKHPNDVKRSCPLKHFKSIQDIPNVKLFSLNLGPNQRKYNFKGMVNYVEDCENMGIVDMSPFLQNFDDLAAIINSLDYIVSVDTAPVHLAGAMGKKVFLATPYTPDWRWQINGEKTDWYPNVRIFRQEVPEEWDLPFAQITKALKENINDSLLQDK